jgi:hypothetical protein
MPHQEPERVYVGLPGHLAQRVLWVARETRTNILSFIPGGSDVVVELCDGRVLGYDWVKKPTAYIREFFLGEITFSWDAYIRTGRTEQIELAKQVISKIFLRVWDDDDEYLTAPFTEVWNREVSDNLPWEIDDHNIGDDYLDEIHTPLTQIEYYGYELDGYEDSVEKAERLFGVPDPRLVED